MIIGNVIIVKREGCKMSNKNNRVFIKAFPGATADDMVDHIKPIIRRKPDNIILHADTNNLKTDVSHAVNDKIISVCEYIEQELPDYKIAMSELTQRQDSPLLESARKEVNKSLKAFCRTRDWNVIPHTVTEAGLNSKGLHLNHSNSPSKGN